MKNLINNLIYCVMVFISSTLNSCAFDDIFPTLNQYSQYRTQKIDYRDSLYIEFTVREWGKHNYDLWGVNSDLFDISENQIEYDINTVFYSPDKKKIFVWVGIKKPNAKWLKKHDVNQVLNCPGVGDTIYSMSALIGIREDTSHVWDLYPFSNQMTGCAENKEFGINVLGQYYFEQMKDHSMFAITQTGTTKGFKELRKYNYNLQDKEFWDKCWIWEKDTVCSFGLYNFQIKSYSCDYSPDLRFDRMIDIDFYAEPSPSNPKKPLRNDARECANPHKKPKITYPETILKLYKTN